MNQTNLIIAMGGLALAAVIANSLYTDTNETPESAPTAVSQTDPAARSENTKPTASGQITPQNKPELMAETKANTPSFDIVRISPEGGAVIAGRAPAGSTVTIENNGKRIGSVSADQRGEWVFVPDVSFPPGTARLTLTMRIGDGPVAVSENEIVLIVPEPEKDIAGQSTGAPTGALALQLPRQRTGQGKGKGTGKVTLLQHPTDAPSDKLSVELLDYDHTGRLTVSGYARPQSKVNLYLDNLFIGQTETDENSSWRLLPNQMIEPGIYNLRADRVDEQGKVSERVSMPFSRAEPELDFPDEPFVIVQPGNSLWRIARGSYGSGFSYTIIFKANKDQIKDANLIYPGQILTLPPSN